MTGPPPLSRSKGAPLRQPVAGLPPSIGAFALSFYCCVRFVAWIDTKISSWVLFRDIRRDLAIGRLRVVPQCGSELAVWPIALVGRSADIEPMKSLRIALVAAAMLIVAGSIASAATGGVHGGKPTASPSAAASESPEPTETEAPEAEATTSDETGTPPNFSACVGRTGLDNAICRHEALLKVMPDNPGLTNSLAHLQANLAAHAAKQAAKDAGTHGNSGTHGHSGSHGPSGS